MAAAHLDFGKSSYAGIGLAKLAAWEEPLNHGPTIHQ